MCLSRGPTRLPVATPRPARPVGPILDAALRLFVAHGYAATTIQTIADEAGVAVQTVYAAFGNKRELMRQLIEATITGDDDPPPVTEGAESRAIAAEPDARRRAQLDAALSRTIVQRVAPLVRVAEEAAASDPELAATMETIKAARRREMLDSATLLAGPEGLRLEPGGGRGDVVRALQPTGRGHADAGPRVVPRNATRHGWPG